MIKRETLSSFMSQQEAFGVLTDGELLLVEVVGGKRVLSSRLLPPDAGGASELFAYLWESGLRAVWVMPTSALSQAVSQAWFEQARSRWNVVVHAGTTESTRPGYALLWPKGNAHAEARRLTLGFPGHAGWDWRLPDARSLLATVTYLDQVLARPVIDVPRQVAHQLLSELTLDQSVSQLRSSGLDLQALTGSDGHPLALPQPTGELAWLRPLTRVEQRQRYLHKYVHCSHALQACLGVQLGTGAPQYSASGRAYDGLRPGIWRVQTESAGSVFDGKGLPSALEGEWMSTPQVNCCRDIGYRVQVLEGVCWPEAHVLLKRWATTLWQAVERLQTHPELYRHAVGRANASHTLRRLAQTGISILSERQETGGWSRPDWGAQIAGRARAGLFAHLVELVRKGMMPALLLGDALWVISDDANPLTAVPGLLTARRWQGYSVGYEVPLPIAREVREVFETEREASQAALRLDTLADAV